MRRNITVSIDAQLLKRARAHAAQRGVSISGMLAQELRALLDRESEYESARKAALAQLDEGFSMGGSRLPKREALYDRKGLR